MANEGNLDVNMFTSPYQLTKSMQRDVYPAIDPTNPKLSAKGKVVLITGAGGGLGNAIAVAWAKAGAAGVVLVGRRIENLQATARNVGKVSESVSVLVQAGDISNEHSVKAVFQKAKETFSNVHVLVNAAGTHGNGMIGDAPLASWWGDFETNVKGTFLTIQSFIQNFDSKGTIINLVSLAASIDAPGISSYSASKLALVKLGQSLNLEYPNIRAFSVHPGIVAADDRGMVVDAFTPFAKDKQSLMGGVSLWLDTPKADCLKGGFLSANWDVNEMEAHATEIADGKLNHLASLNAKLGPEGHPWAGK